MKNKSVKASFVVGALLLGMGHAWANLTGDTVNLTYYFPDSATVYADYGNQTVPTAGFDLSSTGADGLILTVSGTQIIADFNNTTTWTSAAFNGWVLTDLTQSNITGVAIDTQNNFGLTDANISWTANTVTVNWQGLAFDPDSSVTLNVSTSNVLELGNVPEPGSIFLLGLGIAGLLAARRRKAA